METDVRRCTVLIVDVAGSVELRARVGDEAAGRRIRGLLERIIAAAREYDGRLLMSDGNDMLATFEGSDAGHASAAWAAIAAQQLADEAGLALHAGFHCGPVEFSQTLGHTVASGQTVSFVERLHKLTEDAPGRIFLSGDYVSTLPDELLVRAARFGQRELPGFGATDIWTLDWRDPDLHSTRSTEFAMPLRERPADAAHALRLRQGTRSLVLETLGAPQVLGRSAACVLRLDESLQRVSSRHLQLSFQAGQWLAQDLSRNGTWMRDARTGEEFALVAGTRVRLPLRGQLSLGSRFADDPDERQRVSFEIGPAAAP